MAARSGQPRQVLSGTAALQRWRGAPARAARQRQDRPAIPGMWSSACWPHTSGEGAPPGWPGYGCTIRPSPAGTIWHGSPVLAARGCCLGSPATAAPASLAWPVMPSAVAPRWWRGGTVIVAQLWQSWLAGPDRRHPLLCPCAGSAGTMLGRPGNGSTGRSALAGAVLHRGPRQLRGAAARVTWLWEHRLVGPVRHCLA